MTKVIDYILSMDTFEQQCFGSKGMLQSTWLKDRVNNIGVDLSLSNNAIYEHKCLENIKKLYKQAGKCDDQKKFKDILDSGMVSTPEVFTDNSPISPRISSPVNKPSARKSMCLFTNVLYVNKKILTVKLELLNLSASQLNLEIHHGHWNKI